MGKRFIIVLIKNNLEVTLGEQYCELIKEKHSILYLIKKRKESERIMSPTLGFLT